MQIKLKPARYALIASVALCLVYLVASGIIVVFQSPFHGMLYPGMPIQSVYPVYDLALIVLRGVILLIPAISLLSLTNRQTIKMESAQTLSSVFLIYFIVAQPILNVLVNFLVTQIYAKSGVEIFTARAILQSLLGFPYLLLGIANCIFIVASAMIWYFCYLEKNRAFVPDVTESI